MVNRNIRIFSRYVDFFAKSQFANGVPVVSSARPGDDHGVGTVSDALTGDERSRLAAAGSAALHTSTSRQGRWLRRPSQIENPTIAGIIARDDDVGNVVARGFRGNVATNLRGSAVVFTKGDTKMDAQDEQQTDDREQSRSDAGNELSEASQEKVHNMVEAYKDKPTVVLPGSHGTIAGTAINDWLDDEGNPKFGDPNEHPNSDDDHRDESKSLSDKNS